MANGEPVLVRDIVIYDSDPVSMAPPGWIKEGTVWLNPNEGKFYIRNGETWNVIATLGDMSFTGDVHFGEKIYAGLGDANKGESRTITIPDACTMTFKKGLLTDYQIIVPP